MSEQSEAVLPMLSADQAKAAAAAIGITDSLANPNVMRFALRQPQIAKVLADMIEVAVLNGHLDARLREIAILRVGWRIGSVYEWSNHAPIGRRAGLSDTELVAIRSADPAVLTDADRVVIDVVDEVLDNVAVSPATLTRARALLGDGDDLLELVAIPGFYRSIGSLLLTFGVPLESHQSPWAPDGVAPPA